MKFESQGMHESMSTSNNKKAGFPNIITRRSLLRGALATTAAIPLLNAQHATGQGTDFPKRLLVFYTPNGTRNSLFWPTQSATGMTFPQLTAPLEPYADQLLFLDGIRHCPAVVGDNGFNGGLNGSEHARGIGGLLTARPLGTGAFESFMATSGWGTGISIDQHLAKELSIPSLAMGVHVRDSQVRGRISYTAADQPVSPFDVPSEALAQIFPELSGPTSDSLIDQRKGVFELTYRQIDRLAAELGDVDRGKLEHYRDSLSQIEGALTTPGSSGTPSDAACQPPEGNFDLDLRDDATQPDVGKLQMDLAVAALACDKKRILTLQWNYAESDHYFPFLDLTRSHHIISHDWQGTTGFEEYGRIHTWFAEQLAYLLGKLAAVPEGDGTLLDNTIVFWGSEIGESTSHDLTRMPYMLAGGKNAGLKTGRVVDYKQNPQDNNQLLVSLAQMMGASNVTSFGDPSGATGDLPDLLA